MSWPQHATPCPPSVPSDDLLSIHPGNMADNVEYGDTTSNIDFTSEFQAPLRATRPKRQTTAMRPKRLGKAIDFAIHSDQASEAVQHDPSHSNSILAQPAQRLRSSVSLSSATTKMASSKTTTLMGNSHHTRSTVEKDAGAEPMLEKVKSHDFVHSSDRIKKPARRGTVYIPSEDTTMPTLWMGVFSPIKDIDISDENSLGDRPADLTGIAAQMAKKRGPRQSSVVAGQQSSLITTQRQSSVMAAPRRAPLRQSLRPPQETAISEDIPGRMTGKENLPPGLEPGANKVKKSKSLSHTSRQHGQTTRKSAIDPTKKPGPSSFGPGNLSSKVCSTARSAQPDEVRPQVAAAVPEHDVNRNFSRLRLSGQEKGTSHSSCPNEALKRPSQGFSVDKIEKLPAKPMIPRVTQPVGDQNYPLLSEDIQNPSLYENNWLAHQEIAITQLINSLFDAAQTSTDGGDVYVTRSQLLATYQDQSSVILQKRLQASLLFGSLTVPKETLKMSSRLSEDLGMKQKFLNLWLNTYDLQTLQICAEVVIGRECCSSPRGFSSAPISNCSSPKKVSRQDLSGFLEIFLIRNQDMTSENRIQGPGTTGLQRTLLRSLMLINLLDKIKTSTEISFLGCLFQMCSPFKSSVAVIQALAQMLLPSAGNIVRSLNNLEYSLSHVQYPLQEYDYHIENLAVDLRDGVRLTRLVELLLYPSTSHLFSHIKDADATTTITMPTGEVLCLMRGGHDWPLSQHLKLPCLGRATKLYNVQIALSALSGIKSIAAIVDHIKAEHIVDGFREKTVALLWGLACKWGLRTLIDWVDLKDEIRRLGGSFDEADGNDEEENIDDIRHHKMLLKAWAAAAAAKKGLSVTNLTTSFADGRIYEAIVDEYEPYLHASKSSSSSSSSSPPDRRNLSQRLANLGCSAQFASLFALPTHIPAPSTTLSLLSFLSSRLLSPSQRPRAAITIQRAWRAVLQFRLERNKALAKKLAAECVLMVEKGGRLG